MLRLFVGLPLSSDIADRLDRLAAGIPNARWVDSANLHVTLRFIGEVAEGVAHDIHEALERIRAPAFAVEVGGLGAFESGRRPHTLWVGVERAPALTHLRDKVESAVVRAGLAPEPRRFAPHVTIARLKDAPARRVSEFLAGHGLFRAGTLQADRFVLFSSRLGHGGPVYTAEAEYPLEGQVS